MYLCLRELHASCFSIANTQNTTKMKQEWNNGGKDGHVTQASNSRNALVSSTPVPLSNLPFNRRGNQSVHKYFLVKKFITKLYCLVPFPILFLTYSCGQNSWLDLLIDMTASIGNTIPTV